MKAKVIISACLWLAGMSVQAAGYLPEGRWEVAQVTIEKDTEGIIETTEYNSAGDVQSSISCPQEWEIRDSQIILLRYPNGREDAFHYVLEDDKLMITIASVIHTYRYDLNGEDLILTTVYDQTGSDMEHITEQWTITLKQQE